MKEKINADLLKLARPLTELKPDKKNSREHDDQNIKDIMNSLEQFGQQKSLVVLSDGTILAGNGTFRAAVKLGWEKLAVVRFDSKDKALAKAYAIADNRSAETSSWNKEALAFNLKMIKDKFNTSLLGFTEDQLKSLNALTYKKPENKDSTPAARKTDIEEGELFTLGRHRLLCGRGSRSSDVARLMGKAKADLVFTEPPRPTADESGPMEWKTFNERFIRNIVDFSKGGDVYVWSGSDPRGNEQHLAMADAGFHWSATIIWRKDAPAHKSQNFQTAYEPAFYGWLKKSTFIGDRKQTEFWDAQDPGAQGGHGAKPLDIVKRALESSSKTGDLVLDLFAGAGSTLIAAEQTQRDACVLESEATNCQIIIDRWEKLTGQKAAKA